MSLEVRTMLEFPGVALWSSSPSPSPSQPKLFLSYLTFAYQKSSEEAILTEVHTATARKQAQYFHYGTNVPGGSIFAQIQSGAQWVLDQLKIGAASGRKEGLKGADAVKEAGTTATHRAGEGKQRVGDKVKEEL